VANFTYNVQRLFDDLAGELHGTTIDQITNIYGVLARAASQFLLECDPIESVRVVPLPNVIYNQVWDYAIPPDVKGTKLIDIQPQIDRTNADIWPQSTIQAFDVAKTTCLQDSFSINYNTGIKGLKLNAPFLPNPIVINDATSAGNNGTWTTGGDANGLVANNTNFLSQPSSLQFNLSGATGIGYLENSTMQPVNLSLLVNQAMQFLYTSFPTGSQFTSINLRFGSDANDYYSVTATTNQQMISFINGWNLMAFPWLGAIVQGNPNPSAINYLRVTYNYDIGQSQTGVLLNNIVSNLGQILNVVYYSKYMFSDPITGAFKELATSPNDVINLDTDAYAIYSNLVTYLVMQQQQGLDAAFYDGNFFLTQYQNGLARYKQQNPSQIQKLQTTYYKPRNAGGYYGRIGGIWGNRP
jgi:hypothetical protein